jgi:hypothetical protein
MKTYQITVNNSKYINEYSCTLFIQLHIWKYKFWYMVKKQRGNMFHISDTAVKWQKLFNCEILDKCSEL